MAAESKIIIIGAGGHAKVLLDALLLLGAKVSGVCDPSQPASGALTRYPWLPDRRFDLPYRG